MKGPDWRIERSLLKKGYHYIAGVDEAGRGPVAGPVFACAVVFCPPFPCLKVRDSKRLRDEERRRIYEEIVRCVLCFSIGVASHEEIDRLNIRRATALAMRRAIEALPVKPDAVLIDGNMLLGLDVYERAIVKGDERCISIASASIIAKVERDNFMCKLDEICPGYNFSKHKGYLTPEHRAIIKKMGLSPYHRKTFKCYEG